MERLQAAAIELVFLTLHVGLDTFRPIQSEDPAAHKIHTEYYELGEEAAGTLNRTRREGRRIIAVGTTSVRVLEQVAQGAGEEKSAPLPAGGGQAGLFILHGYRFRVVDALTTNFHLPRSTLLMLVSAFAGRDPSADSGRREVLAAYREAIKQRYRFYSFGDAMLIL